jgi:hypothetical protein
MGELRNGLRVYFGKFVWNTSFGGIRRRRLYNTTTFQKV